MDKYELVFDIIEHPESYTSERLKEIMTDAEVRGIYGLLCKTEYTVNANTEVDVEYEWRRFSRKQSFPIRLFRRIGGRAAIIGIITMTSLVAIAVGITTNMNNKGKSETSLIKESGLQNNRSYASTIRSESGPVNKVTAVIEFENAPLREIMDSISSAYGVEVKFLRKDVADLYLYYRLNTALPIEEVVGQLNTFEQINIRHTDKILTLE